MLLCKFRMMSVSDTGHSTFNQLGTAYKNLWCAIYTPNCLLPICKHTKVIEMLMKATIRSRSLYQTILQLFFSSLPTSIVKYTLVAVTFWDYKHISLALCQGFITSMIGFWWSPKVLVWWNLHLSYVSHFKH